MTLDQKILELRTAREMTQGELAEKLEVSRQSVSKWETGQSVPDLDKIIKLADLFGITVDELVREGERPEPPKAEPRVVYIERERQGLRPAQIIGVILEALGAGLILLGFLMGAVLSIAGLVLVFLGLPLLLARKHPFLVFGWILTALPYLIFNRYWTSVSFGWVIHFLRGGDLTMQAIVAGGRLVLLLVMILCTLLTWKKNHGKKDG